MASVTKLIRRIFGNLDHDVSPIGLLREVWSKWGLSILLLGLITCIVGAAKVAYYLASPGLYPAYIFLVLIIAVLGARVPYADADRVTRFSIRSIGLVLSAYLVLAEPSFNTQSHPQASSLIWHFNWIRWLGVCAGLATLWRPSFGLVTSAAVVVSKGFTVSILGLRGLTRTDYLPVVEFLVILVLGALLIALLKYFKNRIPHSDQLNWNDFFVGAPILVFLFAVAIHFGNYFHSGLLKIMLEGPLFAWLDNYTPALMEAAELTGHSPIALLPILGSEVHQWFLNNYVLTNVVTLATQLISIVALRRVMWALWLTVFYDLTHIVIALLTGIFFWKWILLNAIIVAGFLQLRNHVPSRGVYALLFITVIFGQGVFFTAKLGWYDSQGLVHHYFNVVDRNGTTSRVPSNFFLSSSVTVAQNRMGTPSNHHYPIRTWGSTQSYELQQLARSDCNFGDKTRAVYPMNLNRLNKFVRSHHTYMLDISKNGELSSFDRYPHHIFSAPWSNSSFYNVNLRDVTHYEYVIESICLNGQFGDDLDRRDWRDVIRIEVDQTTADRRTPYAG